ncbi:dna polymerase iii delta subunit [hydrocarbon metagenome]|uniref:DNA polymerase III subunit delta n=1 Tax=hydrocarbon metagenome TaxID=938273 RepID=A0A0W8E787_9ZZZZ
MKEDSIYFLWGKEHFLLNKQINQIVAEICEQLGEMPEVLHFDTDEITPREFREQLDFSPLFDLYRVAVIKRPYWLGKGKKRGNKSEEFIQAVNDYLDSDPRGQTLIFTAEVLEKTNPLVKRFNKEARIIECNNPDARYLSKWITDEFAARDRTCTSEVVKRLVNSGQDMYYLHNLIEKLCLQAEERKINEKDIEAEFSVRDEIKVFKLTDALLKRNLPGSLQAFHQLLEQGEHPLLFLIMTARQMASMARVKAYQEQGYNNKKIAEITSMKDFMVRKFADSGRHFSWKEIEACFALCMDIDFKIKNTSQDAVYLMEGLIIDICTSASGNSKPYY